MVWLIPLSYTLEERPVWTFALSPTSTILYLTVQYLGVTIKRAEWENVIVSMVSK